MPTADWCQYNIEFRDRATAAHVAAHDLRPALIAAQEAGLLHAWWFVRKRPWKLRHLPGGHPHPLIADLLDQLTADEHAAQRRTRHGPSPHS
jgi:protein-L-isoaspartate(D-aspartate) O-methyltransferase